MAKVVDSLKLENETLRLNSHSHLKYKEAVRALKKVSFIVESNPILSLIGGKGEKRLGNRGAIAESRNACENRRSVDFSAIRFRCQTELQIAEKGSNQGLR